jgi:4-hydroxybenzoyl-CoA thioesterase
LTGFAADEFTLQQKVRFQHCDPAGIVFYPRYFEMINTTVEEWFAQRLGIPFETLHGSLRAAVPTVSVTVNFHAPSRHGDVLEFQLRPTRIGRSTVALSIEAYCGAERRLSMESTLVFTKKGAPQSWPEDIRARISHELDEPVKDDA